jgi:hypothetical protein
MRRANVIDRAYQAPPPSSSVKGERVSARQRRASGARRSRDVALSRSRYAGLSTPPPGERRRSVSTRASGPAAVRRDHTAPCITLDDLGEPDLAPRTQSGPSALARRQGIAPGLPHGPAV